MTTPSFLSQQFGGAKQSQYRYLTTNLLSGALMGDWLPIEAQTFSRVINATGTMTGNLDLIPGNPEQNAANIQACTPRKAVLWCLQDGVPVWNGILYDWVPMTALPPQQVQIQASTMDSILTHRLIKTDLVFNGTDIFDMARGLIQYALNKSPNGQVAGITYSQGLCGVVDSVTFDGSQNQLVSDALNQLVTTYGIEYSWRPYMDDSGNLLTSVDLGYPALGQPFPQSGLAYSFPGNLLDYRFNATGSTCANSVVATAQNGSTGDTTSGDSGSTTGQALTGSAIDITDISNGYPLMEQAVSATGVTFTSDSQLDAYAAGVLPSVTATQLSPLVILGNGQYPPLSVTGLGSYAAVSFTSALHPPGPNGEPGFSGIGRVVSWSCYPPVASTLQAETLQVQLGDMPFEGTGAP